MDSNKGFTTANPLSVQNDDDVPRILLMRHAQTKANSQGLFLGRRDEGVTELGAQQSQRAVDGLVSWHPDRIVCSPLIRCKDMIARPAAERMGIDVIVDERLTEFDFGPIEGMTFHEVMDKGLPFPWGPRADQWASLDSGETFEDFGRRIGEACVELEHYEGRTAVVVHGGVIRGFFSHWLSMDTDDINHLIVRNVDSFVFKVRDGFAALESYGIHPEDLANY